MFFYKFHAHVSQNSKGHQLVVNNKAPFAFPPIRSLGQINLQTKPKSQLNYTAGKNVQAGERFYQIANDEEFIVSTDLPVEEWTGRTFQFQVDPGCSCKGFRNFSFDLIEILSADEYAQQANI